MKKRMIRGIALCLIVSMLGGAFNGYSPVRKAAAAKAMKADVGSIEGKKGTWVWFTMEDTKATSGTRYRTIGFTVAKTSGQENKMGENAPKFLLSEGEKREQVKNDKAYTEIQFSYAYITDILEKGNFTEEGLNAANGYIYLNGIMESFDAKSGNRLKGPFYTISGIRGAAEWLNPKDFEDHFNIAVPISIPVNGYAYLYDPDNESFKQADGVKNSKGYEFNSGNAMELVPAGNKLTGGEQENIESGKGYVVDEDRQPPKSITQNGTTYYLYATRWCKQTKEQEEVDVDDAKWHDMLKHDSKKQTTRLEAIKDFNTKDFRDKQDNLYRQRYPLTMRGTDIIYFYRKESGMRVYKTFTRSMPIHKPGKSSNTLLIDLCVINC
ncbi:MAG: hypothetical protein K6G65_00680 [Lachnospiraceae bacterium]|nr:hypothetical protein [Lachnospiraceae bacterium]